MALLPPPIRQDVPATEPLVIVATGKYVGEGFDYPRLDTLFLALPISWKGLVAQYAGRLHRENEGKKDVRIYDYIDIHEPVCDSMYRKRLKGYASIGYKTIVKDQPTLFDNYADIDLSHREGQIFNGVSFSRPYQRDLSDAHSSIIIFSPKLYRVERNPLIATLCEKMHEGIRIKVLTASQNRCSTSSQKALQLKLLRISPSAPRSSTSPRYGMAASMFLAMPLRKIVQ